MKEAMDWEFAFKKKETERKKRTTITLAMQKRTVGFEYFLKSNKGIEGMQPDSVIDRWK